METLDSTAQDPVTSTSRIGLQNEGGELAIEAQGDIAFGDIDKSQGKAEAIVNVLIGTKPEDEDEALISLCSNTKCRGIELIEGQKLTELICPNCKTVYPKDGYIEAKQNPDLSDEDFVKLKDYLFMCEANLILKKASKAQEYCNKALKIDCRSADVWAYMAKCYFQERKKNMIIKEGKDGVLPIIKFLNVAKEADNNSEKLNSVSKEIATNLFNTVKFRFNKIRPLTTKETGEKTWKFENYKKIEEYLIIWKECFKIYKDPYFLKEIVNELSGYNGRSWVDYRIKDFDELSDGEMDFLINESLEDEKIDYENELVVLETVQKYTSPTHYFRELAYLINKITAEEKAYKAPEIIYGNKSYHEFDEGLTIGSKAFNFLVKKRNEARLNMLKDKIIYQKNISSFIEEAEFERLVIQEDFTRKGQLLGIISALEEHSLKEEKKQLLERRKSTYESWINSRLKQYMATKRKIQYIILAIIIALILFIAF